MHSTRNGRSAHLSWCGDLKDGKDLHRTPRLVQGQENCTLIESMCQVHIYMLRSVTRQRIYYWSVESHWTWSYRRLWGIRHGHQEANLQTWVLLESSAFILSFDKVSLYSSKTPWNQPYRLCWLQTHRDLLASAWVLGSKACTTTRGHRK